MKSEPHRLLHWKALFIHSSSLGHSRKPLPLLLFRAIESNSSHLLACPGQPGTILAEEGILDPTFMLLLHGRLGPLLASMQLGLAGTSLTTVPGCPLPLNLKTSSSPKIILIGPSFDSQHPMWSPKQRQKCDLSTSSCWTRAIQINKQKIYIHIILMPTYVLI